MNAELQTNDNNLEKFAREQYFMKASDEDVFVIVEK
jgi:cell division protein FtsB